MKHTTRILSLLLVLILVCGLLPQAEAATAYRLWVGGVQVTSKNQKDILGNGTASYDPSTKTLTLNKAKITKGVDFSVLFPEGAGSNPNQRMDSGTPGILVDGQNLIIKGSATFQNVAYGIAAIDYEGEMGEEELTKARFTVTSSASLTVPAECVSYALEGFNLVLNGGKVSGGKQLFFASLGNVTINGGEYSANCQEDGSVALYGEYGDLIVNGGSLKISANSAPAIRLRGNLIVNGGTVTASTKAKSALQINGDVILNGGTVTVSSDESIAVSVRGVVAVNGGAARFVTKSTDEQLPAVYANFGIFLPRGMKVTSPKNATVTWYTVLDKDDVEAKDVTFGSTNPFTDVAAADYFFDPVLWAVEKGITKGSSATTFSPYAPCTREQVVTFLWRAAGSPNPKTTKNPFTDVSKDAYSYKAILWAVEKGITKGDSKTTFAPNATCTREQVVTFLWRAAGQPAPKTTKNPFTDVTKASYAYKAILWAVENGVTKGSTKTTFNLNGQCTRGEIVTFLYRAAKVSAGTLNMSMSYSNLEGTRLFLEGALNSGMLRVGDTVKVAGTRKEDGKDVTLKAKIVAVYIDEILVNEITSVEAAKSQEGISIILDNVTTELTGGGTVTAP